MRVRLVDVELLDASSKSGMFALLDEHFEDADHACFERDLAEKSCVLLVEDGGRLAGFTTLHLYGKQFNGEPIQVVYSGDTLVHSDYRRTTGFAKGWAAAMRCFLADKPDVPLYWFLISSGFRTYRFLPVYWNSFYPRYNKRTPEWWQRLLDRLAGDRFADRYDATTGLVRLPKPQVLRNARNGIPAGRFEDPHIAYFARRNPGYMQGDELACIAHIHPDNLTQGGRRMWFAEDLELEVVRRANNARLLVNPESSPQQG